MKPRVYNNMFWDASFSFHNLRLYYAHMVGSLHRSSTERLEDEGQSKAECKRRNIEFNERTWQNMHKIYDEIYPGFFHNAFLMSACALFEHQMKKICALVEEEHNLPIGWDDMERGSVPTRARKLLGFAGVELKDGPPWMSLSSLLPTVMRDERRIVAKLLWDELGNYFMVRNCIAHHNGFVEKAGNPDRVRKYATKKGILADKAGQPQLLLTEEFNRGVCENMAEFFGQLLGAYYGTPLPE